MPARISPRFALAATALLGVSLACGDEHKATSPSPSASLAVTLTPDTVVIGDSTYVTVELTVVGATADSIVIVWEGGRISRYGGSYSAWLRPVDYGIDSMVFTGFASGLDSQVEIHELVTTTPPALPPLVELLAMLDSVHAVLLLDQPAVAQVGLLSRKFTLAGQSFVQRLGTTFAYDPAAGTYQPVVRPDVPADALRYLLYAVGSGGVSVPLTETGYLDLSLIAAGSDTSFHVLVVQQGDTVIDYLAHGRIYGSPLEGFSVDAQARIVTATETVDLRVTGELRSPAFGAIVSQAFAASYPGHTVNIGADIPWGSHQTGWPRALEDFVLRTDEAVPVPVGIYWYPAAGPTDGVGVVRALDLTMFEIGSGEQVTFGVPDTVASAVAYTSWSSLSSPWSGLPHQLSSLSDRLFEPVAFALRVLRGPTP